MSMVSVLRSIVEKASLGLLRRSPTVALRPDCGLLYLRRGDCRHSLGCTEEALDDYLTALALGLDGRPLYSAALDRVALALRDQLDKGYKGNWGRSCQPPNRNMVLARIGEARDALAGGLPLRPDDDALALPPALASPLPESAPRQGRPSSRPSAARRRTAALRAAVRWTFVAVITRFPVLNRVVACVLPFLPLSAVAARLYVWLAQAKADAGEYEAAVGLCDRAIARRPSLGSAYLYRRHLLILQGEGRRAAEDMRCALSRLRPEGAGRPPLEQVREALAVCHAGWGEWLMCEGRPEAALEHYDSAVALRPDHSSHYLLRGECHYALGRPEQAMNDYQAALVSGVDVGQRAAALRAVGGLLACEGRVAEAVAHYYTALALPTGRWEGPRRTPQGALHLARLIQAYDTVAEDVQNTYGKLRVALRIYRAKLVLQQSLASPAAPFDPSDVLILPDDWVRNIGHMGAMDAVLKLNQLGWQSWRRILLLAPSEGTANRHYLSYLDRHVTVVADSLRCQALAPLAATYGFRVAHALYTPNADLLYFLQALGPIQQEWEAQGRPPLFSVSDDDKQRGWRALQDLGVPRDAWFVCLHVRESGYHDGGVSHQALRNANILDYLPAIRLITERGGWVVRMGDPSMTPLPEMDHVLDYAHLPAKADWMDVFLCGQCRFFIGLSSGLSQVAVSFGAPCVYVNWISNVLPPFSARDVFIPKLLRTEADGRLLSFGEMFDPENLDRNSNYYLVSRGGRRFLDSDPSDVRECVREMLDQLDGCCLYTEEDLRLRQRLDEVLNGFGHKGCCRMGKAFLHKYSRLLSCPSSSPSVARRAPRVAG